MPSYQFSKNEKLGGLARPTPLVIPIVEKLDKDIWSLNVSYYHLLPTAGVDGIGERLIGRVLIVKNIKTFDFALDTLSLNYPSQISGGTILLDQLVYNFREFRFAPNEIALGDADSAVIVTPAYNEAQDTLGTTSECLAFASVSGELKRSSEYQFRK